MSLSKTIDFDIQNTFNQIDTDSSCDASNDSESLIFDFKDNQCEISCKIESCETDRSDFQDNTKITHTKPKVSTP